MTFLQFTKQINDYATNYQKEPEIINEIDIIKAIYYLNNISIELPGDCLIFLSALNLCNTYVKQSKSKIGYQFKQGIEYLIDILNHRKIDNIKITCTKDKGTLYIFQIGYLQFSFHDEKKVFIEDRYLSDITWDGIKKQPCAKSIFYYAIENKISVSNKTYRGKDLDKKINKIEENYQDGKITINDLLKK